MKRAKLTSIQEKFVRCGKPGCHCNGGQRHGPYAYRQWREGDTVKSVYLGKGHKL